MTIQTETNKIVYDGLIGQTVFAYNFRVDQKEDMNVYLGGVIIAQGDWTIDGIGEAVGGNVTLNTPLAVDQTVTLLREVDETQLIDYQPFDAFPAEVNEQGLDKLTMMVQQVNEVVNRFPIPPPDSDPGDAYNAYDLPYTAAGAGAVLRNAGVKLNESVSVFDFMTDVEVADVQARARTLDVSAAIQAAIDSRSIEGAVLFPPGDYGIASTPELPGGVYLVGEGHYSSVIVLMDGANVDMLKTKDFDTLTGSNLWFSSEGVPDAFGIVGLGFFGNKENNTTGDGIKIYGKRYLISDVLMWDVAGVGFYSECAVKGGQTSERDMPESVIGPIWIRRCGSHNMLYRGPHDGRLDNIYLSQSGHGVGNTGDGLRIESDAATYSGFCDIGMIHSYGSKGNGIYANIRFQGDHVIVENSYEEGLHLTPTANLTNISYLSAFANDTLGTFTYRNVLIEAPSVVIASMVLTDNNGSSGGIKVDADDVQISNAYVWTNNFLTADTQTAIGVELEGDGTCFQGKVKGYKGVNCTGVKDSTTTPLNNGSINAEIKNCNNAWDHVQSTVRSFYDIQISNNDALLSEFVGAPPDTIGREHWCVRGNNSGSMEVLTSAASGTGQVLVGQTSVVITHGLLATPKGVILTPTNNLRSASLLYVTDIGPTTFTVNTDVDPATAAANFNWAAAVNGGV